MRKHEFIDSWSVSIVEITSVLFVFYLQLCVSN